MTSCVLAFNGERMDPVSETYHLGNGYRAYNPVLMRFTSPDSWSPFGAGGINAYAYCAGDPVNRADPTGHFSIGGAIGAVIGFLGILFTPFTGGSSLAAALSMASVVAGVASVGLGIASELVSDQETASGLGWAGFALGILSGVGAAAASKLAPQTKSVAGLLWSRMRGARKRFSVTNGSTSVSRDGKRSWAKIKQYIDNEENFAHTIRDVDMAPYKIESVDLNAMEDNFFINTYKRDEWIFHRNFRKNKDVPYFASDVTRFQYEEVSSKNGFDGIFPKRIIIDQVVNSHTLDMTRGKTAEELYSVFFQTPNGKSINRILEQFKLKAVSVSSGPNKQIPIFKDFIIYL